jgi:NAD(P)-dependent dehydrogenase (short-subunit alcohol dehydrogenase family)
MFRLNLLTTVNVFGAAIAQMRPAGRGSLVAIGAMPGLKAPAGLAAYAASKAGVLRLVESYADEVKRDGVRVNAVMPGTIDTPQNRASMPDADRSGWVAPEQLAEAIAFLLSDAASGITGALVPVTGRG